MRFTLIFTIFTVCFSLFNLQKIVANTAINNQDSVITFHISDTSAFRGDTIVRSFTTSNFERIEGMQFTIQFDPNLLEYISVDSTQPALNLSPANFGFNLAPNGQIAFSFFNAIGGGTTLPDGSLLFELRFKVIGEPGEICPLNIGGIPLEIQVVGQGTEILPYCLDNAKIEILDTDSLALFARSCISTKTDTNGLLRIEIFGGSAPYRLFYSHLTDSFYRDSLDIEASGIHSYIDSLLTGAYDIIVVDADSTIVRDTAIIRTKDSLSYELLTISPLCPDDESGSIRISNLSGWADPTWVKWGDCELFTARRTDLNPGTYPFQIIDRGGCIHFDSAVIESKNFEVLIETEDESCKNFSDGVLHFNIEGGQPFEDSTYLLVIEEDTFNISAEYSFFNFPAGEHAISISDSNECVLYDTVTIGAGKMLRLNAVAAQDPLCHGDSNGMITFVLSSMNDTVAYPLEVFTEPEHDSIEVQNSLITLFGLPFGDYTLAVIDDNGNGCAVDSTFSIGEPTPLLILVDSLHFASCHPGMDGFISVSVVGGTPPYSLSWDSGDSGSLIDSLAPGTYTVDVLDANNCFTTRTISIGEAVPPVITGFIALEPKCDPINSGILELNVITGSGAIASFDWSNGDSTVAIVDIPPGEYSVTVTDKYGCTDEDTTFLNAPTLPVAEVEFIQGDDCRDIPAGILQSRIITGSGSIAEYLWSNGEMTISIDSLSPDVYSLIVTDVNNCMDTAMGTIPVVMGPEISLDYMTPDDCRNEPSGELAVLIEIGDGVDLDLEWSTGDTTREISGLFAGTYSLSVTDENACADSIRTEVEEGEGATLVFGNIQGGLCVGDTTVLVTLEIDTGDYDVIEVTWSDGNMGLVNEVRVSESYTVISLDNGGCNDTFIDKIQIAPPKEISLVLESTPDTNNMAVGTASAFASGSYPPFMYAWNTIPISLDSIITGLSMGWYTATVTDSEGCTKSDSVFVDNTTPVLIIPESGEISVFPNPFGSTLNVQMSLDRNEPIMLKIYNISGQVIYQREIHQEEDKNMKISTSSWASGVYSIECNGEGWKVNEILIKN